ncbi:MAG: nucleotidyltransferase domain-containing protein [Chloroflexota bacterium]|nr:nucleotidyltransferase domain-containing protein [Chloroflexota bacterium]
MEGNGLRYLSESERAALEAFIARLRECYADEVVHVILFGSKVRGDFDEGSDLDLLVVKSEDWRFHQQAVRSTSGGILENGGDRQRCCQT